MYSQNKMSVISKIVVSDEFPWLMISQWMNSVQSYVRKLHLMYNRKWQDYVYIQCEYKSTKQKIKHLLREENKVKENKIS